VTLLEQGGDVQIRVADTGEGIDAEFLPIMFEPFRQADGSASRRHGGLGLGLAIVKQLVNAHGGNVRVSSEGKGTGATFVVTIPVAEDVEVTPRTTSRPRERVRLEGLRVLCVDDDDDARLLLRDVLADRGAEVATAGSAHEGFAAFERFRPDVIVSDIAMPGGDGYGLIRAIRGLSAERGGRTPAVAVTAHARESDGERAFAAGFQGHMSKPVDIPRLVTVVANLGGMSFSARDEESASSERLVSAHLADDDDDEPPLRVAGRD
jgi:CheY-like chemotaxis protein